MRIATSIPDPLRAGFYISGSGLQLSVLPEIGEEILDQDSNYVRRVVKRIYRGTNDDNYETMLVLSDPYPLRGWPAGPG